MPLGAFYAWPNVSQAWEGPIEDLATGLLDEAGVACLPGTSFGAQGGDYLRFSYANSIENIEEALRRVRAFLESK
jgi:aspartate/methionine/tyrosine aminotransferase